MKKLRNDHSFSTIGTLTSCFKEKFGVPRQPGMVTGATGTIKLDDDPDLRTAIKGLETFSHLWVVFVFHDRRSRSWKPSIRPPRLGGAQRVGVLASRSPHRPNPIGLSVVKLVEIRPDAPGGAEIDVSGVDILDGTPVLDIKPYIPYADSVPDANPGWAGTPIPRYSVSFDEKVERELAGRDDVRALIVEMVELDPRPAFQKRRMPPHLPEAQGTRYGFRLLEFDVQWEIVDGNFRVFALQPE
jgi:tRNA-Thr(GGU) m(6)t(6)A37 methyltransferase TsaA